MKDLQPGEHRLIGKWIKEEGEVKGDQTTHKIEYLVKQKLNKITGNSWTKLFQDPTDFRFWEQTYLEGFRQGGGPQSLICIGKREAHHRFDFEPRDREQRCDSTTIFEPDNITKPIQAKEKRIIGTWQNKDEPGEGDDVAKRVRWLTKNELLEVGEQIYTSNILYFDTKDSRYWELSYLFKNNPENLGPPSLICISKDEAMYRFTFYGEEGWKPQKKPDDFEIPTEI